MKEANDFDLPGGVDGESDRRTEGPLISGRPIRCPLEPTLLPDNHGDSQHSHA